VYDAGLQKMIGTKRRLVMTTPTVTRDQSILKMSRAAAPVARIHPGTSIRLRTADCFADQIQGPADVERGIDWDSVNPATGPVYVEGANPGDTLAVHIEHIEVADRGVMCTGPGFGILNHRFDRLHWRFLTIWDREAQWEDGASFPIEPMIGVIGVAPAGDDVSCGTPGHHGGDMGTRLIAEGATINLPVAVPGALLAAGSLQAAMGDGEVALTGVAVSGSVTLRVSLRKDLKLTDPLLENDDLVATIASAETLDEAALVAVDAMADLLERRQDVGLADAFMLMSAIGNLRVCQAVKPLRTVRFEMPKSMYELTPGQLFRGRSLRSGRRVWS
jgi:amidase